MVSSRLHRPTTIYFSSQQSSGLSTPAELDRGGFEEETFHVRLVGELLEFVPVKFCCSMGTLLLPLCCEWRDSLDGASALFGERVNPMYGLLITGVLEHRGVLGQRPIDPVSRQLGSCGRG